MLECAVALLLGFIIAFLGWNFCSQTLDISYARCVNPVSLNRSETPVTVTQLCIYDPCSIPLITHRLYEVLFRLRGQLQQV